MIGKPEEQNGVLRDCTERFERLGIAYMLTGSMALVHYATPRMTADIDIVVEVNLENTEKIIAEFEPDYYVPHNAVRQAVSRRSLFNLLHQQTLIKVDCVVRKDDEYQQTAFARRRKIDYAGFDLWIISKEDLILAKLNWAKKTNSEMQLRDVAKILKRGYDEAYVRLWASKLGVENLLHKTLKTSGENYVG